MVSGQFSNFLKINEYFFNIIYKVAGSHFQLWRGGGGVQLIFSHPAVFSPTEMNGDWGSGGFKFLQSPADFKKFILKGTVERDNYWLNAF